MTIILHRTLQPYVFCLVGEKMTDANWKRAYPAISSLLRLHFGRGKGGRRPDIEKLDRAMELIQGDDTAKEKAWKLTGTQKAILNDDEKKEL